MKQYLDQQGVEYLWGRIKRNFANLSNNGKVPASQLPSYVDDVEEYESLSSFPSQGEEGKIYVAKNTNLTYRWSGSTYVEISQSIALGETSNTAYPGDKGKQLEDSLDAEINRAKFEEADIRAAITAEKNRAIAAEGTLTDNLNSEISDRKEAIKAESNRAIAAEQALQAKVGSITVAKVTPHDSTTAVSYQLQVNGEAKGVTIDIAKDQSIKDIEVLDMNATLNDDGTIQAGSPVGSTALCISYILSDGTYKLAKLDYSKFLEETEFADGLEVNDHKVYVKVDPLSENFLSVSSTGVKITGVQNAINTAVNAEKAAREAADIEIKNSITQSGQSSKAALNAEIQRAKEAEATITSNLSRHTSDYENPHHVTKAQVGLDNVDNTADINKPISTATQNALNLKADANKYLPLTGGTLTGDLTSPKYVKTGGTNEQILLADGTVATPISADTLNLILT